MELKQTMSRSTVGRKSLSYVAKYKVEDNNMNESLKYGEAQCLPKISREYRPVQGTRKPTNILTLRRLTANYKFLIL